MLKKVEQTCDYLATSRPTAVNLFWALERMKRRARNLCHLPCARMRTLLLEEAHRIFEEEISRFRRIGSLGATLLGNNAVVMTHCNAGALATAMYGTALAAVYVAHQQGKNVSVIACETRPLLQGARLTTWELKRGGIPVTLICDSMAATTMKNKKVDLILVGADRIAANGDVANKIGTYSLALLAQAHNIPFYVAAPLSSFDPTLDNGSQIPIEERSPEEVRRFRHTPSAPRDVNVFNPAFDVTPAKLISAIITEHGIIHRPTRQKIKKLIKSHPCET
jgi:methylthioribose-1-phosphate isomerase